MESTNNEYREREAKLLGNGTAVLIPCYNEAITIAKVIDDFRDALPLADIYVYDNNSTDDTARIAQDHGAIVRSHKVQGKGSVCRQMLRDIKADYYVMVDGDDTYPADAAPQLLQPLIDNEADTVVGDRLSNGTYGEENKRAFHGLGNNLVRWLIKRIYKFDYTDVMTGYRSFSSAFADNLPILSDGFEIETELSIHSVDKNWRIAQVPVDYRDRPEGSESKLSTFSDGYKVIRMVMSLFKDYRPLALFTWLAIISWIIALLVGIPIVGTYNVTGLVPRIPSVMLCAGFGIAGLLLLCCGMILDTSAKTRRKSYEVEVIKTCRAKQEGKKETTE